MLFSNLYDLHLSGVAHDTRIIVDDGELAIHWHGPSSSYGVTVQWWLQLGQTRDDNVVLLLGVSLTEAQEFVDILYSRNKVSNRHFTVIEDTGVTDEDIYNNNISDDGDRKLLLVNVLMKIEKNVFDM